MKNFEKTSFLKFEKTTLPPETNGKNKISNFENWIEIWKKIDFEIWIKLAIPREMEKIEIRHEILK
jgi:hypothetical protein